MTSGEACRILGVAPDAGAQEIKRRYRLLMRQVHPDGGSSAGEGCAYSAQEVNLACEILRREQADGQSGGEAPLGGFAGRGQEAEHSSRGRAGFSEDPGTGGERERGQRGKSRWDAPVNESAFTEREIFHYAQDCDGNILGSFPIARGKYLWKTEEDFPLFLLSLSQCSRELLDQVDQRPGRSERTALRRRLQPELTYLLSEQFIDGSGLLPQLAREKETKQEKSRIFYVQAMLELTGAGPGPGEGEILLPARLSRHRLYLKNREGQELGYLSFPDDRLYYVIIPLFEQKRARIRVQARENREQKRKGAAGRYRNLHLWIRLDQNAPGGVMESLNVQIRRLLREYERG